MIAIAEAIYLSVCDNIHVCELAPRCNEASPVSALRASIPTPPPLPSGYIALSASLPLSPFSKISIADADLRHCCFAVGARHYFPNTKRPASPAGLFWCQDWLTRLRRRWDPRYWMSSLGVAAQFAVRARRLHLVNVRRDKLSASASQYSGV